MMCAYRKDVFDQEGIKVPPLGTSFTHTEWTNIVKRLTKDGQKGTSFNTQAMQVPSEHWSNVMLSAGGRWFDEKLNPTFNSKEGLLAAEWMRDLLNYAPKDVLRYTNVETNEAMMSGQVVTQTLQWASRIPMVEDKEKSKVAGKIRWTTLPFAGWVPGRKVGLAANDGWCIAIPKASKHQREAFDFAVWCVTKDKQARFISELQVPPDALVGLRQAGTAPEVYLAPGHEGATGERVRFPKHPRMVGDPREGGGGDPCRLVGAVPLGQGAGSSQRVGRATAEGAELPGGHLEGRQAALGVTRALRRSRSAPWGSKGQVAPFAPPEPRSCGSSLR